ncbi:uncharacterized protein LOC126188723 isoform X1 [Schistocerca cancellata]|uniref:uncharacterized protein LOC126188723 isoform X1 n=2 Tax=Schistocerca cancellata TaxID=274614 RepID=UPI0021178886|nr:uncharacterized protein LOC126188723 isoform X1 [Schistocerca cancellata]
MDWPVCLRLLLLLTAAALVGVAAEEDLQRVDSAALRDARSHIGTTDDTKPADGTGSVASSTDATGVWDVLSLNTENTQLKTPSASGMRNVGNNTYANEEDPRSKMNFGRKKQRRKRLRLSKAYSSNNSSTTPTPVEKLNHTSAHHNRKQNRNSKTATERRRRKKNKEERRRKRLRLKLQDRDKRKQRKKNERLRRRYRKERKRKLARKLVGTPQTNITSFTASHQENTTHSSLDFNNSTVSPEVDVLKNVSENDFITPSSEKPEHTTSDITATEKMEQDNSDYLKDDNFLKMQNEEQKDFHQNVDNILLPFATGPILKQNHLPNKPTEKDGFEDKIHFKKYENLGPHFPHTVYRTKQSEGEYAEQEMDENDTSLNAASSVNRIMVTDSMEEWHKDFSSYDSGTYHYAEELGDLSCLNGTLLPAPTVVHSWIKYIRLSTSNVKDLLFAEYRCKFGYRLAQHSKSKLLCVNRRWVGNVPKCLPLKVHESGTSFCDNNKGGCDQMCVEAAGKPTCLCFKGFTLNGTVCKDIDECATSNGGCEYKCQNSAGTYRCLCPPGLRLGDDQKSCIDVNECLLRNGHGPCQDLCHNEWGSYKCSCGALPGTRLSSDNHTCEDEDECASGKAGCSHGCLNTLGNAFCLCPMGFMLGPDWKTCQDIDECEAEYLDAKPCELGCVNTVGSYHCRTECPTGWEITTNDGKRSCEDVDECSRGISGCSHFCHNTAGGYECSCHAGYMLAPDNTTCVDGAMRDVCPPLDIPPHGYVECARSASVQPEQRHARVVNHAGAVCELRCPHGYRQRGEYRRVCGRDRKWQGPNSGHCIPWPVPVIQCPKNVTYYLDPGRSTAYIEFPKPRTSVDWSRNIESFPQWGKDLEADLPEGHWEVKFIARHPVSHHVSDCTFSINVVKRTFQVPVP